VTIITSGNVSLSGSGAVTLTAPSSGIPGVLLITTTTGTVSFSGGMALTLTGVVYAPNASFSWSGNSQTASTCLEFIVRSASISGTASLSGNCVSLGALGFVSQTSIVSAKLVI
jgi:hypothetical protein